MIEISREARKDAITSIKRYFEENMSEPIRDLPAGLLLTFFVEEIGPIIYNRAVADVQNATCAKSVGPGKRAIRSGVPVLARNRPQEKTPALAQKSGVSIPDTN